jgi:hypothetical protein
MSDYTEHLISMAGGDGDQLAAIEARAQAATEGPWTVVEGEDTCGGYGPYSYAMIPGVLDAEWTPDGMDAHICGETLSIPDAKFIAHARTDVPALLAMVREQRAALDLIANQANAAEMLCRMNGMDPELASVPAGAIRAAITATVTA